MKNYLQSTVTTTALAIFSMLFGAGNLMFPIKVGINSGDHNIFGVAGFILTAVCLPILGLIGILLFDGDYRPFLNRAGKIPGALITFLCMLTIGPLVAMPRIVTLSYTMTSPFLPTVSLFTFSILFLVITFLCTIKESKIVDLLGTIVSPLLLVALTIIIIKGLVQRGDVTAITEKPLKIFLKNLEYGYQTLDLLGTIFFSSIVITILKKDTHAKSQKSTKKLVNLGLKSGLIGSGLLGVVYIALSYLGVLHGQGLESVDEGHVFSIVAFRILGQHGALVISTAVLMACFSTIIALAAVVSEYIKKHIFRDKVSYGVALILLLLAVLIPSNMGNGLATVLSYSAPFIYVGYPVMIMLTMLNIAYQTIGFKPVKGPLLATFLLSWLHQDPFGLLSTYVPIIYTPFLIIKDALI